MLPKMLLKLAVFISCCFLAYGSDSSEELKAFLSQPLGVAFVQSAVQASYEENKIEMLSSMIRAMQESIPNITVVGTQNVVGPNGELVEIRTTELHIPQLSKHALFDNINDDDDDDDDEVKISEIKEIFDVTSKIGFPMEAIYEEYNKAGDVDSSAYIEDDFVLSYGDGIYIVNKTIKVNNSKIVYDNIKELQGVKSLPVAIHKFDVERNFVSEESNIVPEYTASVIDADVDVDQEILYEAQKGLTTVFLNNLNNQNEVPRKLSEYLSLKYPKYDFYVFLNEPKAWYMDKDFKIDLVYDFTSWDNEESGIMYSIFAKAKDAEVTNVAEVVI